MLPKRFYSLLISFAAAIAVGVLAGSVAHRAGLFERPVAFALLVGAVAAILAMASIFYSLRKRTRFLQENWGGSLEWWLSSHVWLGATAAVVGLIHALTSILTKGPTSGKIALAFLIATTVVGIAWRFVYRDVPKRVRAKVGSLSPAGAEDNLEKLKRAALSQSVDLPDATTRRLVEFINSESVDTEGVKAIAAALSPDLHGLLLEIQFHRVLLARKRRYRTLLQAWRILHIPLGAGLVIAGIIHVVQVAAPLRGSSSGPQSFASANDCASCHTNIAREWRLSMHSSSQTSPTAVAQMALAVQALDGKTAQKVGEFCKNCHAPIQARFSDSPVLDGIAIAAGRVESEGITCIACHSLQGKPATGKAAISPLPITEKQNVRLAGVRGSVRLEDIVPTWAHNSLSDPWLDSTSASAMCSTCHSVSSGDAVFQSTFEEWDIAKDQGRSSSSCVDCHMQPVVKEPLVQGYSLGTPTRLRRAHYFAGVDYDLDIRTYAAPDMPPDALAIALTQREKLLKDAVKIETSVSQTDQVGFTTATVTVQADLGHDFPTGFAFAREFWLEVSAESLSGPVCLRRIEGHDSGPCGSGKIDDPQSVLPECSLPDYVHQLEPASDSECDPWLVNFQSLLTDGDEDGDGILIELPYQVLDDTPVRLRLRKVDSKEIRPIPAGEAEEFEYIFGPNSGGPLKVKAVLRHRNFAPALVRAFGPYLPRGLTSVDLLNNLTIVDVASNLPLPQVRTRPSPQEMNARAMGLRRASEDMAPALLTLRTAVIAAGIVAVLFFVFLVRRIRVL